MHIDLLSLRTQNYLNRGIISPNYIRMKILDRYIIKKFLGTFLFTIALIISIAVVFDISEKMDDFLEKDAPLNAIIFDYYMNFIPFYVNLFMFLFTFLSVVFFTSRLAARTEIVAMLTNGVSFNRLLYPYFISALIIAILSYGLSNYIIPPANTVRLEFESNYLKGKHKRSDRHVHKQIEPGVIIYLESYNRRADIAYKFSIEKFVDGELRSKLISEYMKWDTTKGKWTIYNYYIRDIDGMNETLSKGRKIDTTLNILPEEFHRKKDNFAETLTGKELDTFIEQQTLRGTENIEVYLIEKYKRTAFPFSTFILTLIGVALASRKMRGGTGVHLGIGLLIAFSYILFMQISFQFSIGGGMSPLLAVWIPNIIFSIVAVILYRIAPK